MRKKIHGLTEEEVQERILQGKVNIVDEKIGRPISEILRANLFTLFNAILGSLFIIILFIGELQDSFFGLVVIFNSLIGITQEIRAKLTLDRLSLIVAPKAKVIRGGTSMEIPVSEIVLDDLVELVPGEQIVADGIVIVSQGLEIDESLLTGESIPIRKKEGDLLLSSSFNVSGTGIYQVTKVGADSYANKLSNEAKRYSLVHSELHQGINTMLKWITWIIFPAALILLVGQFRSDQMFHQAIISTIAGIVGMIPQGLVLLTSMAYALSVIHLGRRNVLAQQIPAVEVLARADILCLDKTGTLTEGTLQVSQLEKLGNERQETAVDALGALAWSSVFRNRTMEAIADAFSSPNWVAIGDIPFSPERKWSAMAFRGHGTWFIGAPEILLKDSKDSEKYFEMLNAYTREGFRVLLLSKSPEKWIEPTLPEDLKPCAFVLLNEKVRKDVEKSLAYFAREGVTLKIISGDNPATAAHVAVQAGMELEGDPVDARTLPDDETLLAEMLDRHTVFGRVAPHQKQSIVKALQSKGHVVAMTGDGVNDVLALKDADLGIAMGTGVAAVKSVSEIVLLDGKFTALPDIVAEGRRVIANIERVSNLFITKTVYSIILVLLIGILGWPFPFLPRHLTLASDFTIGIPGFFLALAPNLKRYHPGFVRRVLSFTIPVGVIISAAILLTDTFARRSADIPLEEVRTLSILVLLLISLWLVGIMARPLTGFKGILLATMAGCLTIIFTVPFLRDFFALPIPSFGDLIISMAVALIAIAIIEIIWSRRISQWIKKG